MWSHRAKRRHKSANAAYYHVAKWELVIWPPAPAGADPALVTPTKRNGLIVTKSFLLFRWAEVMKAAKASAIMDVFFSHDTSFTSIQETRMMEGHHQIVWSPAKDAPFFNSSLSKQIEHFLNVTFGG